MNKSKLSKNTFLKYCLVVDEWFINGFNGAAAYLKHYPNIKKDTTARTNFSRLQALPEMKEYIHKKHQEAAKVYETTCEGTLKRLKAYLEADLTESIGMSKEEVKELPVEIRSMVTGHKFNKRKIYNKKGVVVAEIERIELSFMGKERLQEMVNKHIGFYKEDNKQKAPQINYEGLSESALNELWQNRKNDD